MPTAATTSAADLADRYGEAWNDHDLEAILSDQAEDSVFHLHLVGIEPAADPASVRAQCEALCALFPDMHLATERGHVCEGLFVHEFRLQGTLAQEFPLGEELAQPGSTVDVDGVDVIPCRGGKVPRKDTYMDALALRSQLGLA